MHADVATAANVEEPGSPAAAAPLPLWRRLSFELIRTFLWGFARLFSLRGLYLFGQAFGTLEWLINYKRRGRFRKRLGLLLGDELSAGQRRAETRRFFMRTRCDKMFYLILDKIPREQALARLHYRGTEKIDQALAGGRGCFVAMSHHGTYHIGGMLMALRGYHVVGIRDPHEGGLRRFVQEMYNRRYPEMQRLEMLYADTFPREIYRRFRRNYLVGAALDVHRSRGVNKRTQRVRVLGQEREFLVGTLLIALRCGAGVLQAFVISEPGFHYRLEILGPLVSEAGAGESPEVVSAAMQAYARNLATFIRRDPNHISRA